MNLISDLLLAAFKTGVYICPECGKDMTVFEEEGVLVCEHCGFETDTDHYGFTDDEYEELYPLEEDLE